MQDIKVYSAATVGFGLPSINLFLQNWEPVLKDLVLLGQFGVAVVTVLYVYRKWKNSRGGNDTSDQ